MKTVTSTWNLFSRSGRKGVTAAVAAIAIMFAISHSVLAAGDDMSELLLEMQVALTLSDEQVQQVGGAMATFAKNMEATLASQQSAGEDKGPEMLSDVKMVRDTYRDELQEILSKEQYNAYLEIVDAVQREMMSDVAAIRLMDLQSDLQLSDDQVEQIAPIIGDGMHGMISLLMDNVDKRLSVPRKIKLGRSAKKIQSDMDKQLMPLLTNEQQQTYEANKEARKD